MEGLLDGRLNQNGQKSQQAQGEKVTDGQGPGERLKAGPVDALSFRWGIRSGLGIHDE
jgi:hypothetical protein